MANTQLWYHLTWFLIIEVNLLLRLYEDMMQCIHTLDVKLSKFSVSFYLRKCMMSHSLMDKDIFKMFYDRA